MCSCDSKESDRIGIEVFAYPNPFAQSLTINLIADSDVPVEIYLYNRSYQEVNLTELNEGRTITRNPIVDETISSNEENTYSFDFGEMDVRIPMELSYHFVEKLSIALRYERGLLNRLGGGNGIKEFENTFRFGMMYTLK